MTENNPTPQTNNQNINQPMGKTTPETTNSTQQTSSKTNLFIKIKNISWDYYLPWITGILFLFVIIQLILIQTLSKSLTDDVTQAAKVDKQIQEQKIAEYELNQNQENIKIIEQVFLDELGIINIVKDLENQLSPYMDTDVRINKDSPVKTENQAFPMLPISISAVATPSAYLKFINHVKNEPYLFQPIKMEFSSPDGINQATRINYLGNIFVSPKLIN